MLIFFNLGIGPLTLSNQELPHHPSPTLISFNPILTPSLTDLSPLMDYQISTQNS